MKNQFIFFTQRRMRHNMQIIWQCLYWYFHFQLSLRDVTELLYERGITVSHVSIYNWILKFSPSFEKTFRRNKQPVNTSWKVDETYIKVRGVDRFLYRAVDTNGNTIDFLLTLKRNLKAAKRFFKKSIKSNGLPGKVNTDKAPANMSALNEINDDNKNRITTSSVKYLNNNVEQDHRFIKKRIRSMLGFKNFKSARIILSGIEILHMIFKGQSGYLPLLNQNPIDAYWDLVQSVEIN